MLYQHCKEKLPKIAKNCQKQPKRAKKVPRIAKSHGKKSTRNNSNYALPGL